VELTRWGGSPSVRLVPDGALNSLPIGPPLPPPGPNECARLHDALSVLDEERDRLEDLVNEVDAFEPDEIVKLRKQLVLVNNAIHETKERMTVIGCV
jgi:hypothetical protein